MCHVDEDAQVRVCMACEDFALATFAARACKDFLGADGVYCTLAFRHGWVHHLIGPQKWKRSLKAFAETCISNMGVQDPLGIIVDAYLQGFAARNDYIKGLHARS